MVRRVARTVALILPLLITLTSGKVTAQESSLDATLDSLAGGHSIRQLAISPDGQRVAWVEAIGSSSAGIYVCTLAAPAAARRHITAAGEDGASDEREISWSPDSRQLAFLSNAQTPDQLQLYVAKVTGGEARKLTNLRGSLDAPSWSPDGKTLALLFTENAPRVPGPLEPMTPPSGVIDSKIYEQRLTTVDVASGRVQQVSQADLYVYEYDWSPDGKKFVLTAAHGAGDANWYVAEIYSLQANSGEMKTLYKPDRQISGPRWSPDGSSIAFVGGLMSDEGATGGDVYLLPAAGGSARNLTPGLQASASGLTWRPGGDEILLLESVDGASGIATLDVRNGKVTTLWSGPETLSLGWWNYGLSLAVRCVSAHA